MKKILVWMLCVMMLVSLTACGDAAPDGNDPAAQSGAGGTVSTPVPTQKSAETDTTPKSAETDVTPDPAGADSSDQDTSTEENKIADFLSAITVIEVPELFDTIWDFTGGYENGKELEADEVAAIWKEKGYLIFYFPDATTATMEWSGTNIWGEYSIQSDGYTLGITMDDNGNPLPYAAVFTNVDGEQVMILFLDENAETIWYFTLHTDVG